MRRLLAALSLAALPIAGFATTAAAQQPCDSYSGGCHDPGDEVGGDDDEVGGGGRGLPLTGGDVVLLAMAGVGAVAGGGALITVGRRRHRAATG